MCGRYANFLTEQDLIDAFEVAVMSDDARLLPPSWNIAPTQKVPIVVPAREPAPVGERHVEVARWGLVPSWAKDPSVGSRMFNARSETMAEKPSFRAAFSKRRCLVPASGYYEWKTGPDGKTPYFIHPAGDAPLAFAGLYEFWRDKAEGDDAPWMASCSIVTVASRDEMQEIHDRQPAMLTSESAATWLAKDAEASDLHDAVAAPAPELAWHTVGKAVGNVRNNDADLIAPVT
ncbi:SOS response-associated peptidase [Demequina zhanjiangensis]|uniref:Abasic site processing protein n=1 Tax=Demequina zhanjiangensis TaxID=3051659 RepID=A0ABT8G164_9MICO|nr:SOS response-associated peptidase [Demequina sp. SYSU T00b26]MDN4472862.1 SOS response-associated peptidase [Demequina sp. SYSU T00b26]